MSNESWHRPVKDCLFIRHFLEILIVAVVLSCLARWAYNVAKDRDLEVAPPPVGENL